MSASVQAACSWNGACSCASLHRVRGFTYITVLIVVAIMGSGLAAVGILWQQAAKREKEQELLFVGGEFRRAIGSYFEWSPGAPQYPRTLDDLLIDKRLPTVRRHLRKIYFDPMTASQDWGIVKEPGGGILGVYSKAIDRPLKKAKFRDEDKGFATALTYADWKFAYGSGSLFGQTPGVQSTPSVLGPAAGEQASPVPIAPPTDPSSAKEDPAREARRLGCEAQRAREEAACQATGSAGTQTPDACAAGAATRFNSCLEGAAPAG